MDDPSPRASKFQGQLRVAPTSDCADTGEPNSMLFANGHQKAHVCPRGNLYALGDQGVSKGTWAPYAHEAAWHASTGEVPTGSAFIYSSGSQQ